MLGGGVPQGGQTLLELAFAQGKAACQRGAAVLAHSGHQGIGVGRTVSSVAAVQGLGVAGFLDITARAGGQHPDSRVVPVQDAHQCEQQLFSNIMPLYVGQLVGQHTVCALRGLTCRDQQNRMQRPRHHGAAHQRRSLHLRALALRQGVTPAFSHRLRVAPHANTPDGIAAELVHCNGQNAQFPNQRRKVSTGGVDGKAFQNRAAAGLNLCAGHDVMRGVVGGRGGSVRHIAGGLLGRLLL